MDEPNLSNESVGNRTRQSLLWYTIVPFSMEVLRFANSIILARILDPSDFGIIGIISVIMYYCDSYSDFGFGRAIIQKKNVEKGHYTSYFSFNITISLCFFLSAQLSSGAIAEFFNVPELASAIEVYSFLFLFTACAAGPTIKLSRELNFKTLAIINAIRVLIAMAVSLSLALNGYGFWSMIYSMISAQLVALILLLYVTRLFPKISLKIGYLKDLFHFGMWDFIGSQANLLADNMDKIIIGKILGTTALGFYDKAHGIARMPNDQISMRLSAISFSTFSRTQDDAGLLENYFSKMIIINAVLLFPVFLGLYWVADDFVLTLLGEKWVSMIECFKILLISFIFAALVNPINAMNNAAARVRPQTLIQVFLTIPMIGGLVIAAPYGIERVAMILLIYNVLFFLASFYLLNSYTKLGWNKLIKYLTPPTLLVAIMCFSLYILDILLSVDSEWQRLIWSIFVGGGVFGLSFLLLPFSQLRFLRKLVLSKLLQIKD